MPQAVVEQSKAAEFDVQYTSLGKFGIGTFIGEEWIYQKQYTIR